MAITIAGERHWLWRAVDQDGFVLDEIVQPPPQCQGRQAIVDPLLKKQGVAPKRMITDKLRSYGAAMRQVMPEVEHRSHKGLNNRAENSHVPLRKRERSMQGFGSPVCAYIGSHGTESGGRSLYISEGENAAAVTQPKSIATDRGS